MSSLTQGQNERLQYLLYRINQNQATATEQREYLDLLYTGGYVSESDYRANLAQLPQVGPSFGEALVGIGVAVLLGMAISELIKGRKQ
jgi:hypothetical protein